MPRAESRGLSPRRPVSARAKVGWSYAASNLQPLRGRVSGSRIPEIHIPAAIVARVNIDGSKSHAALEMEVGRCVAVTCPKDRSKSGRNRPSLWAVLGCVICVSSSGWRGRGGGPPS